MNDAIYDDDDPSPLYESIDGSAAYATYTVYVDVGDAETKFKAFMASLSEAAETKWIDREWK